MENPITLTGFKPVSSDLIANMTTTKSEQV